MAEQDLSFSTSAIADTGSFKLLELPPDLLKLIESSLETLNPLTCVDSFLQHLCTSQVANVRVVTRPV